ncbi:MAG: triose-phosphate isomerase [Bacteroidales bacterium]|nr:triose-phosphate isomerase [Bacteroidales bacterium]MDD4671229.1 triose-phosphate isomerase [Bacteroidales bacterium]
MRRKIVAGNWKMNTTVAEGVDLAKSLVAKIKEVPSDVNLIIAPPFTHLVSVAQVISGSKIALSAQNCADEIKGAYTGEVSVSMLKSAGCAYTILGHSERREYYGETSSKLVKKIKLALNEGVMPIFCVGEKLEERNAGKHFVIIGAQLSEVLFELTPEEMAHVVIAYEPVWAIGTGVTATSEQAQEIHAFIRKEIAGRFGDSIANDTSILYGGSCKPSNAKELFACKDIDGGLIGGAALKADDFIAIAQSY